MYYRPYVSGLNRHAEDDTPAQAPGVGLAAMVRHTKVVGAVDAEAEDVLVHQVPHRRVHMRTKWIVVMRRLKSSLKLPY